MWRFLKGLIWFLFNIPMLGIPYLIWGRNKITDNSTEDYYFHVKPARWATPKELEEALKDINMEVHGVNRIMDGRFDYQSQWYDKNNTKKLLKYCKAGVLEHSDECVSKKVDSWIQVNHLRL